VTTPDLDYMPLLHEQTIRRLIPARYRNGFATFNETLRPEYPALKAQALAWANAFTRTTTLGLYLCGKNGAGKTHLACAIAERLIERNYIDVEILNVQDYLMDIKRAWDTQGFSEADYIRGLAEKDLVVLDDLGAEQSSDWSLGRIFALVHTLGRAQKPLVVTSNYSGAELEGLPFWTASGRRVTSRLVEMCDPLGPWPAIDQRIENAKKRQSDVEDINRRKRT